MPENNDIMLLPLPLSRSTPHLPLMAELGDNEWDRHKVVMWVIETTTDPDAIAAAADMIPFIFWPPGLDVEVTKTLEQLQYTFDRCYDPRGDIIGNSWDRARTCYIGVLYIYTV